MIGDGLLLMKYACRLICRMSLLLAMLKTGSSGPVVEVVGDGHEAAESITQRYLMGEDLLAGRSKREKQPEGNFYDPNRIGAGTNDRRCPQRDPEARIDF